ncbi:hypothetical protein EJ110_NYTH38165 [Nymphaea thermarum]|nr:hypothetical protein EJ110_NYTH38165 [Nymphaea thermarum]
MLLSASVNSISSMPSPVYQCKKAFLLNIAVNCSLTRRNISWIDVELPMKAIAVLGLLPDNVKDSINEFSPLCIVSFGPVVPSSRLSKDKVVRPKDLTERPRSDAVHGSRLEIHEYGPRHVPSTARLVVVHIDPLELQIGVAAIPPGVVDAVLIADHLPKLGPNLVAALTPLDVKDLTHLCSLGKRGIRPAKMDDVGGSREGRSRRGARRILLLVRVGKTGEESSYGYL